MSTISIARTLALAAIVSIAQDIAMAASTDTPSVLSADKWPTSVSEVVADLKQRLSESDRELIRKTPRKDLIQYHHGFGTGIRNYYGLWRGNEKLINSACGKPCHPDDASMIIIEAFWQSLQK